MRRFSVFFFLAAPWMAGEVHTLSLREAIDIAVKQNPEVVMARLDELKAQEAVRIARDPFSPRVIVGSGLAYTAGFPMSVEGSAPSIVQGRVIQSLYNKPKSFEVAAARENARGAALDAAGRRDDIAHRTALLYLEAQRAARGATTARELVAVSEKLAGTTQARVGEGRDLPIESRRAALRLAQAKQRLADLESAAEQLESSLALILGFGTEDRVRASSDERAAPDIPAGEKAGIDAALANNKEVQRLESAMQARGLEARAARSAWLPQIDLIAQYGLFAKFNNYEEYFRRFQRHNGQFGASIAFPIFPGKGAEARASQADIEVRRLRTQTNALRDRITLDTRKAYGDLRRAESARELAKLDLEVTREQLTVLLAQSEEGRASLRQVEEMRATETEKWLAYFDSQYTVERAQMDLLRQTGTLLAALR